MIVGNKTIPIEKLREACKTISSLRKFSDSLVPKEFRHVQEIIDNQRYLTAVYVKRHARLKFKDRQFLSEGLVEGITVRGVINTVLDIEDLLTSVDFELLLKALFEDEINAYRKESGE